MEPLVLSADGHELADLVEALSPGPASGLAQSRRFLLGITGAPGSGKSTLASVLAGRHGATVVPMDGFHLADVELSRRGLLDRKGAPETFDAWGYAELLRRVRARPDHTVLAPAFDRVLEQPVAGSVPVEPDAALVVTEGNYLLLDQEPWPHVRATLDRVWHVVTDDEVRVDRLVRRHVEFGKSPAAARAWVRAVDEPNAVRIEEAAPAADLILDLTRWSPA